MTTEYLKCVTCDLFYINDSVLSETDVPKKESNILKNKVLMTKVIKAVLQAAAISRNG